MAVLNISFEGHFADFPLDTYIDLTDADVRGAAARFLRAPLGAFEHYVVDRFTSERGERRIFLRPKVPFGGPRSA